jgi:DNA-binding response OmpR family regulator
MREVEQEEDPSMTTALTSSPQTLRGFAPERTAMKRILLVDDNRGTRDALTNRLKEYLSDVTVTAAGDGNEALRIITTGPIDMLITEVDLPGMDGYELIGLVRQQRPAMPIMVTTDDCSKKVVELLTSLGVDWWIEKPFEGRAIAAVVRNELDLPSRQGGWRENRHEALNRSVGF